jgi:hypothetical protein
MPGSASPDGAADPTSARVGIANAVSEAVRYLSRTGHCRTSGGVVRIGDRGKDLSYEPVARDVSCTRCGLSGATLLDGSVRAYRSFQAADVPIKANWSRPINPLDVPGIDSTIKVLPIPGRKAGFQDRPDADRALGIVASVLAIGSGTRRDRVPSVGGANLLNVFVCGADDTGARLHSLDRRRGSFRPVPANGLDRTDLISADHLTIVVSATLSRAGNLFGGAANITIYQDTGFTLGELQAALAHYGLCSVRRPTPAGLPEDVMHVLGLDSARDVVTAVVDVALEPNPPRARPPARRRTAKRPSVSRTAVDRRDLDAVLAAVSLDDVEAFVRCRHVDGMECGLYRLTPRFPEAGLRPVSVLFDDLDTALDDRGLDPAAVVLFTTDVGRALSAYGATGVATCAIDHAQSAQHVRRAARERGLDALLLVDLPSTALAPDGRGWRTACRSFAAVALAARGVLDGSDDPAVRW